MDETTRHDDAEPTPSQDEEGQEHAPEFDPEQIENDPSQNPPIEHLKDLKGG